MPTQEKQEDNTVTRIGIMLLAAIEDFSRAWQLSKHPPDIRDFLTAPPVQHWALLVELIKIDLEYRYQVYNFPKRLQEYLEDHAELCERPLPADLIFEEYYFRSLSGLSVDPKEYLENYPDQADSLHRMFDVVPENSGPDLPALEQNQTYAKLAAGMIIDDFELIEAVGAGSFAKVFKAHQRSMNRVVAVKISPNIDFEPQTLAQLDHPNIVRVYDQRSFAGLQFLYMEYVSGGTLLDLIERGAKFRTGSWATDSSGANSDEPRSAGTGLTGRDIEHWSEFVCRIGSLLASALAYANRRGILHLDIKPANILLTVDGRPKLADFNTSLTSRFATCGLKQSLGGTLAYMSPEYLQCCHPGTSMDQSSLDARSDIFSLGVTLWQLLFGKRPFPNKNLDRGIVNAIDEMIHDRDRPVQIQPDIAKQCPGLVDVLKRSIDPDPGLRWQSAADLAQELKLCSNRKLYAMLRPKADSLTAKMRSLVLPYLLAVALLPNMLAGIFNYYYNKTEIISGLPDYSQAVFWNLQMTINIVAFPLGLFWLWMLARPVIRYARQPASLPLDCAPLRRRCLNLGHLAALINITLWSIAGLAYPAALHFSAGALPVADYPHFFGSLVFCGLITSIYPFFLITAYCVRMIYPGLIGIQPHDPSECDAVSKTQRRLFVYLSLAALVPLLIFLILFLIGSKARTALLLLSAANVVGLALIFWLFRLVQSDLTRLSGTMD